MFKVNRIEVRGPIHKAKVQLGMGEFKIELGMLIHVKQDRVALDKEQLLFLAGGQDNAIDEDVDDQPVQDLALNVDNVFQADDCDAFDSDVDEAPTAQTMFMANLSSVDPVCDEVRPSYDSDILSEVHNHDHYQDAICKHHKEHAMHDNVQLNHVVDSYADYKSDSNMIPYDQYVKDNAVPVVHIVENSLIAKLGTYKEQVELYERRASAKQVQPILYNGHEIIKYNHVPAIVHNTDDTLKIAEITIRKMNDKIKDPEYVTYKVKIAPHDYLKENFLPTFTPQKQLTPEQIFWSQDHIKMKTETLKEQTTASIPIKELTVAIFLAVASLFFWQWQTSSLAVGTSSASGNSIPGSGNAFVHFFPNNPPLN
nr:retrovirus-related Pol polyprotein from transposon TNT 1-94 [Tanacetum cinerariifolium]